jgi:hypothetical protein
MPGAVIRMEAPVRLSDDRMKQRYAAMSTARGATIMNTASARIIAKEHHETLRRWHVIWSRTVLSADATHRRRGSSLVIIISAHKPA